MPLYLGNIIKQGSVDYTVVGSPTITDGVASGFSANDYFVIGQLGSSFTEFEIAATFVWKTGLSKDQWFVNAQNWQNLGPMVNHSTSIPYSWALGFVDGQALSGISLDGTQPLENNKKYTLITKKINNKFYLITKDGNGNIMNTVSKTIPSGVYTPPATNPEYRIGGPNPNSADGSSCEIDLNNTYIKVNGDAWFGPCKMFDAGKYNFKI